MPGLSLFQAQVQGKINTQNVNLITYSIHNISGFKFSGETILHPATATDSN